jgi:ATP-dependent helicase HrpB
MTRLATVRVSRASADQRLGRAGRVAAGICYRLWPKEEDEQLIPATRPEILESDLAPLTLGLAVAGVADPAELSWLDPPPSGAFAESRTLLSQLGALDSGGQVTDHGRAMARLALHPRLAHMVIRGTELGAGRSACGLAALLTERDLLRWGEGVPDADLELRLEILRGTIERDDVDRDALRRARAETRRCERGRPAGSDAVSLGVLVGLAYPDRIARRRKGSTGRFLLRNGQGATLEPQALSREEFLVVADLDADRQGRARILLASPLSLDEIEDHANDIEQDDVLAWEEESRAVVARRRTRLGAIVLRESPIEQPDPDLVLAALVGHLVEAGIESLPWDRDSRSLRARLAFLRRLDPAWPDQSDGALLATLPDWLGPAIRGIRRAEDLVRVKLDAPLLTRLSWDQRARLDELAPRHIQVPSGSRIEVRYDDSESPVLAVRLQEMFGLADTPRVASGRIPVTLHLLSPAYRPVQVTRDLAGFWRTTYFEVRKGLRGRYPRHFWPDDPLQAEPTRHAKRRGTRPGT